MMTEICAHLHNWFDKDSEGNFYHKEDGTFTVEGGNINLPFLATGQYYGVIGSIFNDGIHRYGYEGTTEALTDETFTGTIVAMKVPPSFIALCAEIEQWQAESGKAASSPYQSESFGGYSYTKGNTNGGAVSWQSQFRSRLNCWRKL